MARGESRPSETSGKKWCFVISPIGEPGTDINRRANDVLEFIIIPAAVACGYKAEDVIRADKITTPGIISSQVVDAVVNAPLVIADLTGHNPNVFYELALRHAVKKPIVQIIHKSDRLPFDVNQQRSIFYDHQDLRLTLKQTIPDITAQIKAVEQNPELVDNPITIAVDLQAMRQSGDASQELVAQLYSTVADLQRSFERFARQSRSSNAASLPGMNSGPLGRLTPSESNVWRSRSDLISWWNMDDGRYAVQTATGFVGTGPTFTAAVKEIDANLEAEDDSSPAQES